MFENTQPERLTKVLLRCKTCKRTRNLHVNAEGYAAWAQGTPLHDALPALSVSDGDWLTDGHCDDCITEATFGETPLRTPETLADLVKVATDQHQRGLTTHSGYYAELQTVLNEHSHLF